MGAVFCTKGRSQVVGVTKLVILKNRVGVVMIRLTLHLILTAVFCVMVSSPCVASDVPDLPAKVSGLNGWHGARIESKSCQLVFSPGFGKKPAELKLLQELQLHYLEIPYDLQCVDLEGGTTALNQIKQLAVSDQIGAAASLIVFGPHTGKLFIDGEVAETYGEDYLYPVLLEYKDLNRLIPDAKEAEVATDVCNTLYNPNTSEKFNFKGLIKHLKKKKMQSLVNKIKSECSRIEKENSEGS